MENRWKIYIKLLILNNNIKKNVKEQEKFLGHFVQVINFFVGKEGKRERYRSIKSDLNSLSFFGICCGKKFVESRRNDKLLTMCRR